MIGCTSREAAVPGRLNGRGVRAVRVSSLNRAAYPPERSGVAEGELNAGRKSAAALSDFDTTDAIRPQSDPAISPRQIRRVEPTRHDYHSKLPQ